METGMISVDSDRAKQLGFTSDRFSPDSYLWDSEGRVTVSLILGSRKGSFKQLVDAILAEGKEVAVPTPLGRMRDIVSRNGYQQVFENVKGFGQVEVWILKPATD